MRGTAGDAAREGRRMVVECPHCGRDLDFPDGKAGDVCVCNSCGGELRLPDPYPRAGAGAAAGVPPGVTASPAPEVRRAAPPRARASRPGPGLSTAAIICGAVGVFCPVPLLGIAAIVMGVIAVRRRAYQGLAVAAIVMGVFNLAAFVGLLAWFRDGVC